MSMFHRSRPEILTSLLNGKKKKNKIGTSASPEQETLIQSIEAHFISLDAPKKTGVSPAKVVISSLLVPAATPICAMNVLHRQLSQVYRPIVTKVTIQHYQCKLSYLLILQQEQQE